MLAALALGAGWFCGHLVWPDRAQSDHSARIVVAPDLSGESNPAEVFVPFNGPITTEWLVNLADHIDRLNGPRLTRLRREAEGWHPLAQRLVLPLIQARQALLDPPIPRATPPPINPEELALLMVGGDRDQLGGWIETEEGVKVLECLRAGDIAGVFAVIDDGATFYGTLFWFCQELGKLNPRQTIEWIQQIKSHQSRQKAFGGLVSGWANEDPEAAMAWLESLPPGLDRSTMGDHLLQTLQHRWPNFGLENIDRILAIGTGTNSRPAETLFKGWISKAPDDALAWAKGREDADEFLAMAVDELSRSHRDRAVELYQKLPPNKKASAAGSIVTAWLSDDPDAAGAWARSLENEEARSDVALKLAAHWANRDSDTALQWLSDFSTEELIQRVGWHWMESFLAELDAESSRRFREELREVFSRGLPEGLEDHTMRGVFNGLAEDDPSAAAELLTLMPDQLDNRMVSSLAHNWGRDDPAAAAQWVAGLPEGETMTAAAVDLFDSWAEIDRTAAASWLEQYSEGLEKTGLGRMARSLASAYLGAREFELAKVYADQIDNPLSRGDFLESLYRSWVERNPEAAFESYRQTDLSEVPLAFRAQLENVVFFGRNAQ